MTLITDIKERDVDMEKRLIKRAYIIVLNVICIVILGLAGFLILHNSQPIKEDTFTLSEIADDVYAYKETIVSSIPAYNYTIITVCDENGCEHTIKGSAKIIYQDIKNPYAVIKDYNIVYSDEITLYIPFGIVEHLGTQHTMG